MLDFHLEMYLEMRLVWHWELHLEMRLELHWGWAAHSSPALFDRCVVDWFGTWGSKAIGEVGRELPKNLRRSL